MGYRQIYDEVVYYGNESKEWKKIEFVEENIYQEKERWLGREANERNGKVGRKISTLKGKVDLAVAGCIFRQDLAFYFKFFLKKKHY